MKKDYFRLTIADLIITFLLAFMFTVAPSYISKGCLVFSRFSAIYMALNFILFLAIGGVATWILSVPDKSASNKILTAFDNLVNRKNSLGILTLLMFLFWLPTLIILYPGTAINDTWGQLTQYLYAFYSGNTIQFEYIGDHHPVITTFIMGQIIVPIGRITGNMQIGFFVYVLFQSLLTCLTFSYSLIYIRKKLQAGAGFVLTAFLLYSLFPIFPCSAQTICKASMSAVAFTIFTVLFMELLRSDGKSLDSRQHLAYFVIICWAVCVTKKVSFYVVGLSLLAAIPAIHRNRRKLGLILIIGTLLIQFIWPMAMIHLGITPSGKTEMLSLPYQMTARYVKEHPDDITEEEYAVIDNMLQYSNLAERYDAISADPVKGFAFYERFTGKEYADYFRVWLAQGLRHPDSYINAILAMESGWFSFSKYYPLLDMEWHSQLNPALFSETCVERPAANANLARNYQKGLDALYNIFLLRPLFSYGLYASLLPAFVISTLMRKIKTTNGCALVATAPMFFSIALGCWLAPLSIHFEGRRYLYPVTYTILVMIAWCRYWLLTESRSSESESR